ncbi:inositol monophosphatase family protein [Neobacillus notoginsengisoli]|uniref:inositol-phosphate phosphatase n=1 Tax=Neobacillus notoginsengisoli TaxID=1578198 RepID=A0A417YRC1_9BACI|nr:inositol monophosphatase family protein [Neobacillus notoginsengisoli]RHW36553.1 inositol monophosphatase family protein [Neobacillus notoginsengisoli]
MDLDHVFEQAKSWVLEAGEQIRSSFDKTLNIHTKADPNDLVTNIDRDTEKFFIEKIRETFPGHRILGEEGFGDELSDLNGVVWIIDPIDGTMNFIHQQRNFAISVGIYENGVGKIGLIYDIVHDELYYAVVGLGAFLNEKKIPKLKPAIVKEAILAMNITWVLKNKRVDHKRLIPLVREVRGTRSYGSAALELVYVATGRINAYISPRLAPWDYAGGAIIVEELGGIVTNLEGGKLDMLTTSSVFAASPGLHGEILEKYLK